jgi:hypothetical protein
MNIKRIYISGAITLDLEKAPQKFDSAVKRVRELFPDAEPVNPMTLPHPPRATWEEYMALDIAELKKCDAIYMLPCWTSSQGARLEHAIARKEGLTIIEEKC